MWENVIEGQLNLRDAIRGTLAFTSPEGKDYALADGPRPTIVVRPRGWHLPEKHILVDGEPHLGQPDRLRPLLLPQRAALSPEARPYFYLPKMESHLEARLWNDVFSFAEDRFGRQRGTIRATVLIETFPAAFEMEEILYELREHSAGLNAGRWDYMFSVIKKFRTRGRDFLLPDRNSVTMTVPFMRAYTELLVRTCHKRGAHAIGGMAAFIPSRRDPEVNEVALAKVRDDKTREAGDGFDGSWVAHPDLVPVCREVFDGVLGDRPNQLERTRDEVQVTAEQLLDVASTPGEQTEAGLRNAVSVGIQYLQSWLKGNGAVAIFNMMEDAATAEISRSQVWQWLHNDVTLADTGVPVTRDLVERVTDEELAKLDGDFAQARGAVHGGRRGRRLRRFPDAPRVRTNALTPGGPPHARHSRSADKRLRQYRPAHRRAPPGARGRPGDHRPAGAAHVRVRRPRPLQGGAGRRGPAPDGRGVRGGGEGVRRRGGAVRGARLRHRAVRRRAPARRRRADRHLADCGASSRSHPRTSGPWSSRA